MFTGKQIDDADWVQFVNEDTGKALNVGYFEPTSGQGPYLCSPVPPFGGLSGDAVQASGIGLYGDGKAKNGHFTTQKMPRGWPVPPTKDTALGIFHVHEFTDGNL